MISNFLNILAHLRDFVVFQFFFMVFGRGENELLNECALAQTSALGKLSEGSDGVLTEPKLMLIVRHLVPTPSLRRFCASNL
jgi:hypothetical protein